MKHTLKRAVSLLLVVMMVLSLAPVSLAQTVLRDGEDTGVIVSGTDEGSGEEAGNKDDSSNNNDEESPEKDPESEEDPKEEGPVQITIPEPGATDGDQAGEEDGKKDDDLDDN